MVSTPVKALDKAEIDVFTSFVDSLAEGPRAMVAGAILQFVIIGTLWLGSPHPVFIVGLIFVVVSVFARTALMRAYRRETARFGSELSVARYEWAKAWELKYRMSMIGASLNIGVVSLFGLFHVSGPFHTAASLTLVFASVPSVIGRLFGSKPLALSAILCLLLPPSFGAVIQGDMLFFLLGAVSLPYAMLTYSMVNGVREPVEKAVRSRHQIAKIAAEFDLALNNMTHALLMFDDKRRVLVANDRALDIFGFVSGTQLEGHSLKALLRFARLRRTMDPVMAGELERLLGQLLEKGGTMEEFERGDGKYLQFSARVRRDGTSVLVAEEVTDRVMAKRVLEDMARHDGLTGLMNRHYFAESVKAAVGQLASGTLCAIGVLDIDDFKHINDSIGHLQGDRLLESVSERLKRMPDKEMLVARHGGDEFLVFVPGLADEKDVTDFANRLNTSLSGLYRLDDDPVKVGISVGLHSARAAEFDLNDALVKADIALYRVKTGEKNSSCLFEQKMEDAYRRRQYMKSALIEAIDENGLDVHYQPIVDIRSGRIASVEALARWSHPVLGNVSPAEFIPLAEEVGLIPKVTEQVLSKAMRACVTWPGTISVSVNLSAIDFHGRKVERVVRRELEKSGLDPQRLELEITEGVAVRNTQEVLGVLKRLREMGVRIALDDFGTGYSSLSHMHELPLDSVKIDRSFVHGVESDQLTVDLLNGIMSICKVLGRSVTVEGVETIEQLESVMKSGLCNRVQGFIFGTALPETAIADLTHKRFTEVEYNSLSSKEMAG